MVQEGQTVADYNNRLEWALQDILGHHESDEYFGDSSVAYIHSLLHIPDNSYSPQLIQSLESIGKVSKPNSLRTLDELVEWQKEHPHMYRDSLFKEILKTRTRLTEKK
jgi:hypothetical protein